MTMPLRLALIEPDIAGNVGTLIRACACLDVPLDLVEPMGFAYSDRGLARAGLDYAAHARVARHADWAAFRAATPGRRVLVETDGDVPLSDAHFMAGDVVMLGSESRGAPPHAYADAALVVRIPLVPGRRSLNVAVAAAIVLGEALRQLNAWPGSGIGPAPIRE